MVQVQIGKQGLTRGTVECIKLAFKTHEGVNVVMLKNSGHTKDKVEEAKKEILRYLGPKFTATSLGFTIKIRKWRKPRQ